MNTEQQQLLEALSPELRVRAERGEVLLFPGKDSLRPVVRDAVTGRIVKGSGRPPAANDIGRISKQTAYKRTRSFSEAFDSFIPAVRTDNPEAIISLEELITTAARVAQGEEVEVSCPACKHKFYEHIKANAKLLEFLIERRVGRAKETMEVNIRSEELIQMLNDQSPVIEVVDITPDERAARMLAVKNA